jgi:hypothetical protein
VNLLPTLLALVVCTIIAIGSLRNLNRASARLEGQIRSRADLNVVRDTINLDMFLALFLLLVGAFWIAGFSIAAGYGLLHGDDILIHSGAFAIGSALLRALTKPAEDRFKALKADPLDPEIAVTFERWKKEWRGLRMRLSA